MIPRAPSTLGSFLRGFTFGHVRQLDAIASRFVRGLAAETPLVVHDTDGYIFLDIDDTIIEVHAGAHEPPTNCRKRFSSCTALKAGRHAPPARAVEVAWRRPGWACRN